MRGNSCTRHNNDTGGVGNGDMMTLGAVIVGDNDELFAARIGDNRPFWILRLQRAPTLLANPPPLACLKTNLSLPALLNEVDHGLEANL